MTQNANIFIFHFLHFCVWCISATTLEPVKILTCSAPQNDSFVIYVYVVGKLLARNCRNLAICPVANFGDQSLFDFFFITK